jgi:hypothetical protein
MFIFAAANKVRTGKLDEERARLPEYFAYLKAHEPRVVAFHEFRNQDGTEVEYVQVHPDAASFENHLKVLAGLPDELSWTQTLEGTTSIRIYGQPTPAIMDILANATGPGVPVTVLPEHLGGFSQH